MIANILGLLAMFGLSILSGVTGLWRGEGIGRMWELVYLLTPQASRSDLWYPDWRRVVPAALLLSGLGLFYLYAWLYAVFEKSSMNNALKLERVVKTYRGFRALDGLDLDIPRGSIFGLVGSNGAGKTTTALCVGAGLLRIRSGSVNLLGGGPFRPRLHRGRIALLPQDAAFPGHARVDDLLAFYGRLQGIAGGEIKRAVDSVLEWVYLSDRKRSTIRALSHGMRRCVTIAQAFLGHPELILLDEPLNGLEPLEVVNIRNLIRERKGRQTIVISSHLLKEVERSVITWPLLKRAKPRGRIEGGYTRCCD